VYDAAERHCVEIATHRHGCCVLQRCVDHADATQRRALVEAIAGSSLALAQDPFGNYVVQYVLDLDLPWCNAQVMARLAGTYAELSTQKFSSNVVEKCLKRSADRFELETHRDAVVREIMNSPLLDRLLMDPYGNYVVQSSLSVTHGALRNELVERIKPHLPLIKNSPFGKRILRLLLEHKK
jgi:pumilio RNA-binding family